MGRTESPDLVKPMAKDYIDDGPNSKVVDYTPREFMPMAEEKKFVWVNAKGEAVRPSRIEDSYLLNLHRYCVRMIEEGYTSHREKKYHNNDIKEAAEVFAKEIERRGLTPLVKDSSISLPQRLVLADVLKFLKKAETDEEIRKRVLIQGKSTNKKNNSSNSSKRRLLV
jgi:hypothetical protein